MEQLLNDADWKAHCEDGDPREKTLDVFKRKSSLEKETYQKKNKELRKKRAFLFWVDFKDGCRDVLALWPSCLTSLMIVRKGEWDQKSNLTMMFRLVLGFWNHFSFSTRCCRAQ